MRTPRVSVFFAVLSIPLLAAGAFAVAGAVSTNPKPQVVIPAKTSSSTPTTAAHGSGHDRADDRSKSADDPAGHDATSTTTPDDHGHDSVTSTTTPDDHGSDSATITTTPDDHGHDSVTSTTTPDDHGGDDKGGDHSGSGK